MIYIEAEIKNSKYGSICKEFEVKMLLCDLHREGGIGNSKFGSIYYQIELKIHRDKNATLLIIYIEA